jgi:iron complex outermembrane receptor protein
MSAIRHCLSRHAVRLALLGVLLPLPALPALGQEEEAEDRAALERLEVTGSRIRKAAIEGLSPVQVIGREDIDRTGLTSIGDVLQQLTAAGSSLNTKFNSSGNFGFPPDGGGIGAGSTTVDLRHLGPQRVLVLVDGERWVNETSASGVSTAVDLNTIPLAAVERIEVLEDGASALYGSDAIAGVVNIITRRDVDGAAFDVQYGEFDEGDGQTQDYSFSIGGIADRLEFFLAAAYVEQRGISSSEREQSRFPVPGTGLAFGSSGTPNGRFIFNPPAANAVCPLTDLDEDGTPETPVCDITTPNGSSFPGGANFPDDFIPFATENRFNFAPFNLLLTPNRRENLFAKINFGLTSSINWYSRFSYTERKSTNQAAPEPIFLGPSAGTGNPLADNITISATNPFNPFGIDLISGENFELLGRRPLEAGPRIFNQDVETLYFATGLEGSFDLGTRAYYWDANFIRGENEAQQTTFNSLNIARIAQALGPVDECVEPCVPLDLFNGPGTLTQDMIEYIRPILTDLSDNNLEMVTLNLTGDVFELPAGPLALAVGYEHRDQDGFFRPDAIVVAGESNGVPAGPTSGDFYVDEAYLELNVPLLADMPFARRLDLSAATRYSDYSTFGDDFTSKLGLRWQVIDELLLRGTFAEGFRAPSIGELFGSASRFDATLADPCSAPIDPALAGNCAALGVPPGFTQPNPQISVTTGGNPELDAETADSVTFGFVWSPSFASDVAWSDTLDIEFTWYRHELEGAIQAIDAQTQLNRCVESLDPTFCEGITRASTGAINAFNNRLVNLGSIDTEGWDFDVFWTSPEYAWGRLNVIWQNTWVDDYEAIGASGLQQPEGVGVEVNDSAIPEWTSNLAFVWNRGPVTASWVMRHIDGLTEDCSTFVGFGVCTTETATTGTHDMGSATYHDLQAAYRTDLLPGLVVTAGLINAFDKNPPICLTCSLNGLDASTYDLPGRVWYVRGSVSF